jgi:tetratricopeptide (TPR) repeat protein
MKDSHCFNISGYAGNWSDLDQNFDKGDSVIHAPSGGLSSVSSGDWIHFVKYKFDYIPGASEPDEFDIVGQITRFEDKGTDGNGDWGEIKDVANMNYIDSQDTDYSLKVRKVTPVQNIGIEDLMIRRYPDQQTTDDPNIYPYNINFAFAVNCWAKGVESYKTSRNHLGIGFSSHIEVSGCYFHEAMYYGDGGWGYGVVTGASSTNCLIENNIFRKLRHAMVAGSGSNCNVWTFNYSREQEGSCTGTSRDLDLHAKYPFGHLFEHNDVEKIEADDYHGDNGPYNAFVRNFVHHSSWCRGYVHIKNMSYWSTLGNIGDNDPLRAVEHEYDDPAIVDVFGFLADYSSGYTHNVFLVSLQREAEAELLDVSYYYSQRPDFLPLNYTWPAIGPKVSSPLSQNIPANDRFGSSKKTYLADPTPKPLTYAGEVYYDQAWSGTHILTGDITVLPGVTLTILPGTSVRIPADKRILIQGTLIANGTSGNPITFQKSGGSRWYGIEVNNGTLDLDYTTLKESYYGVTVYGSYAPSIWNSTITDNYYRNVRFDNITAGQIAYSTISSSTFYGVQCVQYSSPFIKSYNNIKSNMVGVEGDDTSLPYLGQSADQGLNDLANNWDYDVYSDNANTLYAEYNWWGSSSPDPVVSDNVDWQPYLNYDPTMGKAAITQRSDSLYQAAQKDTTGKAEFGQAYAAFLQGDFNAALSAFEGVTTKYSESSSGKQALVFSFRCMQNLGRSAELAAFLNTKANTFAGKEMAGLANSLAVGHFIKSGQYQQAIDHASFIVENYAETNLHKYALFDLGAIYWYFLNDPKTGETYYRQLIAKYPDDDLAMSALATLGEWKPASGKGNEPAPTNVRNVPTEYALSQNFPNPFNPQTMIQYQLPEASHITVKIYNLFGQEVRTLVAGHREAGYHSEIWDGRDDFGRRVASGVYFYRLSAAPNVTQPNGFQFTRKMVLTQ